MKEQLFFAHANGFPAEVYGEFFESLKNYDLQYIPILAHGTYKLETSYDDVVPEIIDYIESNYKEPIWGIGHSFGASLLASYEALYIAPLFPCPVKSVLRCSNIIKAV